MIDEKDKEQPLYADSAYVGEDLHKELEDKGVVLNIHEKGYKNNPLDDEQKACNSVKSTIRVRVEHVFGFVENSMNGSTLVSNFLKLSQNWQELSSRGI